MKLTCQCDHCGAVITSVILPQDIQLRMEEDSYGTLGVVADVNTHVDWIEAPCGEQVCRECCDECLSHRPRRHCDARKEAGL